MQNQHLKLRGLIFYKLYNHTNYLYDHTKLTSTPFLRLSVPNLNTMTQIQP